ncbi:MAG: SpoIIE family protein phosphatase [Firmicutes bacterium]|nr:SpoIIE family protein phosphatase [Bacillota bacterium]
MKTKKIRPLRTKIAQAIIFIVTASLLCVGAVFLINSRRLSKTLMDSNRQMSGTSRNMSSEYMDGLARERLQELADDKAALADRTFYEFRQAVGTVATAAEKLYAESDSYPGRPAPLPDPAKDGELSVQVLYAPGVDPDAPEIIREAGLIGNLQETLYSVNHNSENLASVYFASDKGVMVQADYISAKKYDEDGMLMPLDAKTRPWYQGAAAAGKAFMTSVTQDAHTPRLGIMCGIPVYRDGKLMGVAGSGMYLDSINSLIESVDLGDKGNVCIVNQLGRILFSTFHSGVLSVEENDKDLRLSPDAAMIGLAIEALRGEKGIKQLSIDGVPSYVAYSPMKTVGWSIFVVLSEDQVEAPTTALQEGLGRIAAESEADAMEKANRATFLYLIVFAAALAIALAVSFLLSKRIVDPIQKLTDKVGHVKGDDLEFNWDLNTGDETQLLAKSFESLTGRIKTYVDDIQKITAEKERIGAELELATRIQTSMLPNIFPAFPDRKDFDVYASMDPAKEVGGDFYDFFLIDDDHLAMVIADVSGKGIPAALFMMVSMILIRNEVTNGLGPAAVLENVNNKICSNNREEMFVTVWLGILDIKTGKLTAANAGHEYPTLKKPDGSFELIKDKHGFVVGGMSGIKYKEYEWDLKPGSKIFVYTDGVPEATDSSNGLFGTDRLLDALRPAEDSDPKSIIEAVDAAIRGFVKDAPQFDDITMLCMEYKGQKEDL